MRRKRELLDAMDPEIARQLPVGPEEMGASTEKAPSGSVWTRFDRKPSIHLRLLWVCISHDFTAHPIGLCSTSAQPMVSMWWSRISSKICSNRLLLSQWEPQVKINRSLHSIARTGIQRASAWCWIEKVSDVFTSWHWRYNSPIFFLAASGTIVKILLLIFFSLDSPDSELIIMRLASFTDSIKFLRLFATVSRWLLCCSHSSTKGCESWKFSLSTDISGLDALPCDLQKDPLRPDRTVQ